jgi:hypothetical protein
LARIPAGEYAVGNARTETSVGEVEKIAGGCNWIRTVSTGGVELPDFATRVLLKRTAGKQNIAGHTEL